MINKHCDLIYCNSLKQSKAKQSKANAKLYLLTNNYFKFLFQFQKYFLDYIQSFVKFFNNKAVSTPCVLCNFASCSGNPLRPSELLT